MMKLTNNIESEQLFILNELQKGNEKAFDIIFNEHYIPLTRFCFSFVKDQSVAEGLVQEVFIKLWERRSGLITIDNLGSYLITMTRNKSIDYLRKEKSQIRMYNRISPEESVNTTEEQISKNEFEEKLLGAVYNLPERCRVAFEMSRFYGLTNKEIAHNMQISIKGVEALIARSLKTLRSELSEFLPSESMKKDGQKGIILFSLLSKKLKFLGSIIS
jgi:RNA polymerase sigma-70 factor (ECF subfamily)